jgi:hypothetical protein
MMTSNFRYQETRSRDLDALVGTKVSVKYIIMSVTELKRGRNITV